MIRISIECRIRGTTFTKSECIEEWLPKRTNKAINVVFRKLLDDMRSRVKDFTAPKVYAEEPALEETEK
jgi:hypothetical protein